MCYERLNGVTKVKYVFLAFTRINVNKKLFNFINSVQTPIKRCAKCS